MTTLKRGPKTKCNAAIVRQVVLVDRQERGSLAHTAARTGVHLNTVQKILAMTVQELRLVYGEEAWPR